MKIFDAQPKTHPDWFYWGNYGQIDLGISSGEIRDMSTYIPDALHYHRAGVIYVIVTDGEVIMEVGGKPQNVSAAQVLEISPMEQYRCLGASLLPARWLTICTVNDKNDKVIVE